MRQNIFMGGGPFSGAALGQVSDEAIDRKFAECKAIFDRWTKCVASGGRNSSACIDLGHQHDTCIRQVRDMLERRRSRSSNYQWRAQPAQQNYQWNRTTRPAPVMTTPTSQPSAAAGSGSDVACYFCPDLQGAPTYWMSADQARQWNSQYAAGCTKVKSKECEDKYGQSRATQTSRQRVTSGLVSQYANPYGSAMTGIRVQNPELLG